METKYVRVPFNLELAKEITNGTKEGRIVTRGGYGVRILCFDRKTDMYPIILLVDVKNQESVEFYGLNGKWADDGDDVLDLMLEIPEYMTFKDGDILYSRVNNDNWYVFIYRDNGKDKTFFYAALDDEGTLSIEKNRITENNDISELRFATDEEKQKLIYALKSSSNDYAKEYLKKFLSIEQKQEYEFKPFDKVICRDDYSEWFVDMFSHIDGNGSFACIGSIWKYCLPYNDQTAHLLGTTDNWEE